MPNSILWIALVGMWLFVLLPMQAKRRPRIRQTTDAALATRVLDRDHLARQQHRGPASGHRSDPNWRREDTRPRYAEDRMDTHVEVDEIDDERAAAREYVPQRRGRGGFDPEADAIARAARYGFRQRAVLGLLLLSIMSAALAVIISPMLWWVAAAAVAGLGGYLAYMRRQVQFEQEIRRRRMARLGRSRLGVESREDDELRLIPARLRRPGAVVLEVDDEDPVFEHLDHYDIGFGEEAAPEEMRRVVGQ
ncbi:gephyrin-like molybdotransferase receptor GlpR [Rhodococcus sp. NPDC058514]|uniref:divisome protein SepX/GlpR n=1 Tax=unclassified Rhodococcus (in: high G+C Gram-positive bacteria) TaxID=192944 RepID=UPI00365EAA5C